MKKALALILTAAMLLSCLAIGVSAKRVVTVGESTTDGAWYAEGENYNNWNVSDTTSFVTEVVLMGSGEYGAPELAPTMTYTPYINIGGDKVGYGDYWATGGDYYMLDYDFNVDTWYRVKYVTDAGTTSVYVNDEYVGALADTKMTAGTGNTFRGVYVSDYKITNLDGSVIFHEDFEDATFAGEGPTGGSAVTIETPGEISNQNVMVSKDLAWYAEGENYNNWNVSDTTSFRTSVTLMGSGEYGSPELAPTMTYTPYINIGGDKVGYGDYWATGGDYYMLDYDFNVDEWYTVVYETDAGVTKVYVNDELVGELTDSKMTAGTGNTFRGVYVSDYKIESLDGSVIFHEDFEDATFAGEGPTGGASVAFENEGNKYDLGLWYWNFPEGESYNPVEVGALGDNFDVEMDICIDVADGGLVSGFDNLAKAPVFTTTGVGVSTSIIAGTYEAGVWYHVKWDAEDGKTAIYVDDVYVGTVDATATLYDGTQAFWTWNKISIDNISVGSFFADMEDGNLNEGQGYRIEYDLGIVEDDPLKDVPKYEVGGEAILIESDAATEYLYIDYREENADFSTVVVSYDVAFVPNENNEKNDDGVWLEYWRDNAGKRFKVGPTGAGRGDDVTLFTEENAWGDVTWNNFHNVVIWFENAKGTIYVDGVEMYSGICGDPMDRCFIMMPFNSSVIVDNFHIYDTDMNVLVDEASLLSHWSDDSGSDPVKVNVDTDDFCATNKHVYGSMARTVTETCTSLGTDTTYCAICDAIMAENDVAMVSHQFWNYDNERTVDGMYYTQCANCSERRYTAIPDADSYTGEIVAYFGMEDGFMGDLNNSYEQPINSGWFGDQFRYENGKAVLDADTYLANYSEFLGDKIQQNIDAKNWSYSFRMTYNGLFDCEDTVNNNYPHAMYFWLRGVSLELGYNATEGYLYIGPSGNPGAVTIEKITADYEFKEGLTYTFKFALQFIDEDEYADIAIWINDELVLIHSIDETGNDIYYDCAFDDEYIGTIYCRNFGFGYTMDDLVVGSYDFAWNKVAGDVDNDGVLSVSDAMVMRKYLAKVIGDDNVHADLMDVNGDEVVNAKDQLTIRKALAA